MRVLTANEIRLVEKRAFDGNFTESGLMMSAGKGCYEKIIEHYGDDIKGKTVSVACGNGKNAGDGFVIAKMLCDFGAKAVIVLIDKEPSIKEPLMYYNDAVKSNVPVVHYYKGCFDNSSYIVDCIFGIGFHGEVKAPFDTAFDDINNSGATVVSIDTPSGTNATDGTVSKAIKADFTIAISTLKYCHILPPSNEYCGKTEVVSIGIPNSCYDDNYVKTIEKSYVKSLFKPRNINSNKGTFGLQINICGSYLMPGAAVIAAIGAMKTGVGLLQCASPKSAYQLIASHLIQCVFNPTQESEAGTFSKKSFDDVEQNLEKADSVVLGCGIGCTDDTKEFVKELINNYKKKLIIDADGINCISDCIDILQGRNVPAIITPHPGEMARLVNKSVIDVQRDRIGIAKTVAKECGGIVVLKGNNTVVTDGERVLVNTIGNAGLAMGGTGDLLSGMIGSLLAQGLSPFDAATAGVYIHSQCGDCTADTVSQRGMTVEDLISNLGTLMSEYE